MGSLTIHRTVNLATLIITESFITSSSSSIPNLRAADSPHTQKLTDQDYNKQHLSNQYQCSLLLTWCVQGRDTN
jgi:hypothetical protein